MLLNDVYTKLEAAEKQIEEGKVFDAKEMLERMSAKI